MKTFVAVVVFLTLSAGLYAQKEGASGGKPQFKKFNVGSLDPNSPVTNVEAAEIFATTRKAFRSARIGSAGKSTIPENDQLANRDEVILEMAKIFDASKKAIRFVPQPVKYEANVFKVGQGAKAPLTKLVSWGFVAPYGPLATGPKTTITVKEFGDAVGFFISRMSEVTHTPSSRWSPYLKAGDD